MITTQNKKADSVLQMETEGKYSLATEKERELGITNTGFQDDGGHFNTSSVSSGKDDQKVFSSFQNNETPKSDNKGTEFWGCRHTLAIATFFGFLIFFMIRVSLTIAIVAMVGTKTQIFANSTQRSETDVCLGIGEVNDQPQNVIIGEFDWDEETQGFILGAFYWGYSATNLIGGVAAERFGGRLVFGFSLISCSVLTLFTPYCARISTTLLIVVRLVTGAVQGGMVPGFVVLLSAWVIPKERAKFTSFSYAGCNVGTIITLSFGGWLSSSTLFGGWPSIFYASGILGIAYSIPWFLLIRDSHESHPRVSQEEIDYIAQGKGSMRQKKACSIPWKDIMISIPVWAIVFTTFGSGFCFYTLLSGMPLFLSNIHFLGLEDIGLLTSLSYICLIVFTFIWGILMDIATQRNILSVKNIRKLSTAVGGYGTVVGLIIMSFLGCDFLSTLVILSVSVTLYGANYCGYPVSYQEIAPNLSGTISGLSNTLGSLTGVLAPAIMGVVTQGNQTLHAWKIVFLISASIVFTSTTFFLIFGTSEIQPWNAREPSSPGKEKNKNKSLHQNIVA